MNNAYQNKVAFLLAGKAIIFPPRTSSAACTQTLRGTGPSVQRAHGHRLLSALNPCVLTRLCQLSLHQQHPGLSGAFPSPDRHEDFRMQAVFKTP